VPPGPPLECSTWNTTHATQPSCSPKTRGEQPSTPRPRPPAPPTHSAMGLWPGPLVHCSTWNTSRGLQAECVDQYAGSPSPRADPVAPWSSAHQAAIGRAPGRVGWRPLFHVEHRVASSPLNPLSRGRTATVRAHTPSLQPGVESRAAENLGSRAEAVFHVEPPSAETRCVLARGQRPTDGSHGLPSSVTS